MLSRERSKVSTRFCVRCGTVLEHSGNEWRCPACFERAVLALQWTPGGGAPEEPEEVIQREVSASRAGMDGTPAGAATRQAAGGAGKEEVGQA